jgi:hypothetical protein
VRRFSFGGGRPLKILSLNEARQHSQNSQHDEETKKLEVVVASATRIFIQVFKLLGRLGAYLRKGLAMYLRRISEAMLDRNITWAYYRSGPFLIRDPEI